MSRPLQRNLVFDFDGRQRDAIVYAAQQTKTPLSVVLAFHGAGSCAEQMVEFYGLNDTADQNGFVVVYPNGSGRSAHARTWNGGPNCGYAARHSIDDVGFVRQLLLRLQTDILQSSFQAFATGMSNGGLMCYRLGGGHTWPGHPTSLRFLGTTTGNLDANDVIWDFFQSTPPRSSER